MDNVERVPAVPTEPANRPHSEPPGSAGSVAPAHSAQPAEGDAGADDALPADRVAELHERIRGGGYDTPAAADEVARRILADGDL